MSNKKVRFSSQNLATPIGHSYDNIYRGGDVIEPDHSDEEELDPWANEGFEGEEVNPTHSLAEEYSRIPDGHQAEITAFNMQDELETEYYYEGGSFVNKKFLHKKEILGEDSSDSDNDMSQDMPGTSASKTRNSSTSNSKRKSMVSESESSDSEIKDIWADEDLVGSKQIYDDTAEDMARRKLSRSSEAGRSKETFDMLADEDNKEEADVNGNHAEELSHDEILAYMSRIYDILEPEESILAALRRLGDKHKKNESSLATLNKLTEYANILMSAGEYDVYQQTRESITKRFGAASSGCWFHSLGTSHARMWQLKWGGSEEIHGPFTSQQMDEWKKAGYFASSERAATCRIANEAPSIFRPAQEINFE